MKSLYRSVAFSLRVRLSLVEKAMSLLERKKWPVLGPSVTLRCFATLHRQFTDESVKCLTCFVCGQLRTTTPGPIHPRLAEDMDSYENARCASGQYDCFSAHAEINLVNRESLKKMEAKHPGTLLNIFSYDLF